MDQHHRHPGGAEQAGEQGAEGEQRGVARRCAPWATLHQQAATGGEQGKQQRDEGKIFGEHGVPGIMRGVANAKGEGLRHEQQHAPASDDIRGAPMPEPRCQDW